MLTLFRGDDLAFAEYDRKVCVRFNTFQDLTGWAAKFCLLDNIKQTTDISSRIWTFGYTAEETQLFPLGKTFGKLVILDSTGKVRQLAKVDVEIVNPRLEPCIDGLIAISIDNVIADYNNMGNKPILNGKVIEGSHDSDYYGLASKEDVDLYKRLSDKADAALGERIDKVKADMASALEEEKTERETAIVRLIDGATPVSKLLFEAEDDTENFYRIQVVMRDDGTGRLVPALALDTIPKEESTSGDESESEI